MIKLFIDPGHGGKDSGATSKGLREKDLTLKIALKIREKLRNYKDIQVNLSRTIDKTISLQERTTMANNWQADYLVSIHINAGRGKGFESFIYNGIYTNKEKTNKLRKDLHGFVIRETEFIDRGMKEANFHMLRESRMPACLTENGFIDTQTDAHLLMDDNFLDRIAQGHVLGFVNAFNLRKGSNGTIKYKIKKGDTLWSIAKRNNTTVAHLERLNKPINPYQLEINSTIKIK